jgi:V/A-type H+-transporting ATPase subunit I
MTHLQIITADRHVDTLVRRLREAACLHVEDISEAVELDLSPYRLGADEQTRREEWRNLLTRVDALLAVLPQNSKYAELTSPPSDDPAALTAILEGIKADLGGLVRDREALERLQTALPRSNEALGGLVPLVPSSVPSGSIAQAVVIPARERSALRELEDEILAATRGAGEITVGVVEEGLIPALIVVPEEHRDVIQQLLTNSVAGQIRLPEEFAGQPLSEALKGMRDLQGRIPEELNAIDAQLGEISQSLRPALEAWRTVVSDQLSEFDVRENFGRTERAVVVQGWAPSDNVAPLKVTLEESTNGEVELYELPGRKHDHPPVHLRNPGLARPFESLVGLLALPTSHDMDPTVLMAFFLPLFFGIILGDAGYGLILLLLTLYLQRRLGGGAVDLLKVLRMGSIWSIIFGFLFGEAFGNYGEPFFAWLYNDVFHLFPEAAAHGAHGGAEHARFWLLLDRTDPAATQNLMLLAIGIGVVHVVLGLVIGVILAIQHTDWKHLAERGGTLIGLVGVALVGGTAAGFLPETMSTPGYVVLVGGLILLSIPLGWIGTFLGPIEFFGVIGNILSYLRIAAIGLASVYLAVVANRLGEQLGIPVVGLIVALLFHVLNIALGALSPTIHSLRLHYVEFFRKFYTGGGEAYRPFGV